MAQQSFNNTRVDFDRSHMGTGSYTSNTNTNSCNGKMHSGTSNMDSIASPSMLVG